MEPFQATVLVLVLVLVETFSSHTALSRCYKAQSRGLARAAHSKLPGRAHSETGVSEKCNFCWKSWAGAKTHLEKVVGQLLSEELIPPADSLAHLQ